MTLRELSDRGKLCQQCNCIIGYTPHAPWCEPELKVVDEPPVLMRASDEIWRQLTVERRFERMLTNKDRALLSGMKIALNKEIA